MNDLPLCMYVCRYVYEQHTCLVPVEARGECQIPESEVVDSCELPYGYKDKDTCLYAGLSEFKLDNDLKASFLSTSCHNTRRGNTSCRGGDAQSIA